MYMDSWRAEISAPRGGGGVSFAGRKGGGGNKPVKMARMP